MPNTGRSPGRRKTLRRLRAPVASFEDVFDSRANAIGFLRLAFALLVVVSHSFPLGYAADNPLSGFSRGQTDLGALSVTGFFVLSGLLITRSSRRVSPPRYVWHRVLRIFPAFWVCLLLTAFVLAPFLWWVREGTLTGFLSSERGPANYVTTNFFTSMREYGIDTLLISTPYGQEVGRSVFNGSLWSLRYELICYVVVLVLALIGATRKRPWLVLVTGGVLLGVVLQDWLVHDRFGGGTSLFPQYVIPVLGGINMAALLPLLLAFLVGSVAACFPAHFPLDGRLALLAGAAFLGTMRWGGFDVVGPLAFAYLVLWAAARLPRRLHRVGVRRDVSYGVYIYAFPAQQVLALTALPALSHVLYVLVAAGLALLAGAASWELVEKRAMRWKDVGAPESFRRRTTARGGRPLDPVAGEVPRPTHPEEEPVGARRG